MGGIIAALGGPGHHPVGVNAATPVIAPEQPGFLLDRARLGGTPVYRWLEVCSAADPIVKALPPGNGPGSVDRGAKHCWSRGNASAPLTPAVRQSDDERPAVRG